MYQGLDDHAAPQDTLPEEIRQWIEEQSVEYAFQTPHDGHNKFYSEAALKQFADGAEALYLEKIAPQLAQAIKERDELKLVVENIDKANKAIIEVLNEDVEKLMAEIQSLREAKGMRFVKGSERKPPDGVDGQILHIKPFRKHHKYEMLPKTYFDLIYFGKYDGGLKWHWHEGPNSGCHTKIDPVDWDSIEWLDESI